MLRAAWVGDQGEECSRVLRVGERAGWLVAALQKFAVAQAVGRHTPAVADLLAQLQRFEQEPLNLLWIALAARLVAARERVAAPAKGAGPPSIITECVE